MTQIMPGLENLFGVEFTVILPFLLVFAIVYGILEQFKVPRTKSPKVIIALILALLMAPSLSSYITVLMNMIGGFVVLISGFLVLIILLEVMGVKAVKKGKIKDKEGKEKEVAVQVPIFKAYPKQFAIVILILVILIFVGSGGMDMLGWKIPTEFSRNYTLLFFLGMMALIVWWMASEK